MVRFSVVTVSAVIFHVLTKRATLQISHTFHLNVCLFTYFYKKCVFNDYLLHSQKQKQTYWYLKRKIVATTSKPAKLPV